MGEAGFPIPRTGGTGVIPNVTFYYLPSSSTPLSAFEREIHDANAVFISRVPEAHGSLTTAAQYQNIPLILTSMIAHPQPPAWRGWGGFSDAMGMAFDDVIKLYVALQFLEVNCGVGRVLLGPRLVDESGAGLPSPVHPNVSGMCVTGHGLQ